MRVSRIECQLYKVAGHKYDNLLLGDGQQTGHDSWAWKVPLGSNLTQQPKHKTVLTQNDF